MPLEIVKTIIKAVEGIVTVQKKRGVSFDQETVSMSAVAALIADENKNRRNIYIRSTSGGGAGGLLYLGNSSVASGEGIRLFGEDSINIDWTTAAIYGITSGDIFDVEVIECD